MQSQSAQESILSGEQTMIAFGSRTLQLLALVAPGPAVENPKTSADVVTVETGTNSIADGLETYFVTVRIARGGRFTPIRPERRYGAKLMPVLAAQANLDSAIKFAFLIDGKPACELRDRLLAPHRPAERPRREVVRRLRGTTFLHRLAGVGGHHEYIRHRRSRDGERDGRENPPEGIDRDGGAQVIHNR